MRYTIGCEIIDKSTNASFNGIYLVGKIGLPYISTKENTKYIGSSVLSFHDLNEANTYCRYLSRIYRRDDIYNKTKKSKKIRKFYLLKIDSLNFPYKIVDKPTRIEKFYYNAFIEKQDKPQGYYELYPILK